MKASFTAFFLSSLLPTKAQNDDTLDNWTQVFGRGSEVSEEVHPSLWAPNALSGEFYVRRICPSCNPSHQDIIYKRLTALPNGFDVENLFVGTWSSENNLLDVDFELYSSMSYALAGILSWDFCNYDDNAIGFPRDCGQNGFVGWQWTSLTRGGQADYAYYVLNENTVSSSISTPTTPPTSSPIAPTKGKWDRIYKDDFETDQGIFKGEKIRLNDFSTPGGEWSLRIKRTSDLTTKKIEVSSYSEVSLRFEIYGSGMDAGDAFILNAKFNDEKSWTPVEEWICGTDFNNEAWVNKVVYIKNPDGKKKIQFQFKGSSDKANDRVYIDDVLVKGKKKQNRRPLFGNFNS